MGLLVVLAAACSAGEETSATEAELAADEGMALEDEAGAGGGDAAGLAEDPAPAPEDGAGAPAGDAAQPPPPLDAAVSPEDRIIKQGTVALEVEQDGFDAAYARVVEASRRYGGSVLSSSTRTEAEDGTTSGSVTLRVPAESYEDLLVGVGEIGEVRSRDVTAEDVSEEFVDLEARRRNLEAQERFYLGLLEEAAGVPDAIAVQQQLTTVTEQLEQVKGRLAFLDERTRFSTLTVELTEPGATPLVTEDLPAGPSLARSWQTAQDAFVNVVGALLVAALFLAPIVLPALLLGAVAWRVLRRRPSSRVAAPPPRAPGPPEARPPAVAEPPDREPQRTP